jgi:hypothetical protein
VSEGSFQNRILFCVKYKVLFHFAIAASVAVEVLDAMAKYCVRMINVTDDMV